MDRLQVVVCFRHIMQLPAELGVDCRSGIKIFKALKYCTVIKKSLDKLLAFQLEPAVERSEMEQLRECNKFYSTSYGFIWHFHIPNTETVMK